MHKKILPYRAGKSWNNEKHMKFNKLTVRGSIDNTEVTIFPMWMILDILDRDPIPGVDPQSWTW